MIWVFERGKNKLCSEYGLKKKTLGESDDEYELKCGVWCPALATLWIIGFPIDSDYGNLRGFLVSTL